MPDTRIAKLINDGDGQAVCLPDDFQFEGKQVYATKDEATGDVVLSSRPSAKVWAEFFTLLRSCEVPADYMKERPLNSIPADRGIFDDELPPPVPIP